MYIDVYRCISLSLLFSLALSLARVRAHPLSPSLSSTHTHIHYVLCGPPEKGEGEREFQGDVCLPYCSCAVIDVSPYGKKRPIHIAKRDLCIWALQKETYSYGHCKKRPIHIGIPYTSPYSASKIVHR